MINRSLCLLFSGIVLLAACTHGIQQQKLTGTWKYVKIDKTKPDDTSDTTSLADLKANDPSISFTENKLLTIHWGGKVLSHGTFKLDGDNINYTEQLEDGTMRTFPFYVSKLDDNTIVFETLGNQGSRVTTVKK